MLKISGKTLIIVVTLGILMLLLSASFGGLAQVDDSIVTVNQAASTALYYVDLYSDAETSWQGATLVGPPMTYYSVDNRPVAYEFTVLNDKGADNGFIIISATKDWMPVLERGLGKAPSSYIGEAYSVAIKRQLVDVGSLGEPVIYYFGAFSYYTQFGQKMIDDKLMINLCMGDVITRPEQQPTLSFEKDKARAEWDKVNKATLMSSSIIYNMNLFSSPHQSNTIVQITGVPSWWQVNGSSIWCDEGDGSDSYPDCQGPPDDPWDDWDGCGPIAGAMVLGYWDSHGYPNFYSWDDEYLIDDCHYYMNADYYGATDTAYVTSGIHDVSVLYEYDFTCTRDTSVLWSDITTEINAGRPFVLAADFGDYGSHGVTVRGYNDSTYEILVHDTYDNWTHYITFEDWNWAHLISVIPG